MSATKNSKTGPEVLKSGSFSGKLYQAKKSVGGRQYGIFRLVYTEPGGRRRVRDFAERQTAIEKWRQVSEAWRLNRGDALSLSSDEVREHQAAVSALDGLNASLFEAAKTFAAATHRLPAGIGILEAVDDFLRRHPSGMAKKQVDEVVQEMIADADARRLSAEHLRDLRRRLRRFAADFQCPIASITPAMLRDWIRSLTREDGKPMTNRSKFNFQRMIVSLFHFARRQRYITRDQADELAELDAPKPEPSKTGIFSVEEMRRILEAAPDDIRPALAIAAFTGIRTAELARITWDAVKLAERVIVVGADRAKTASRRIVPMPDNLVEWLTPLVRDSGPVSPSPNDRAMNHRFARTAAKVGVKWRHNALRHSAISYRLAVCADAARVAAEAGNSPNMVHRHYKALVSQADGEAWFDIRPFSAAPPEAPK
ncbi:MAG: tyrosine-type recombinase/integrase [Verrucomicrobiae bacterium]|nr:tyrosine-type recombinase/integrase [Verrucomicrobiae bacterium]